MKAEDFDKKFDEGVDDIIDDLDLATKRRPHYEQRRINVDVPSWMIDSLDQAASRTGVTRQSIIKVWLVERLQDEAAKQRVHVVQA